MRGFIDFSVRTKLLLGTGLLLSFLCIIVWTAWQGIKTTQRIQDHTQAVELANVADLWEFRAQQNAIRALSLTMLLQGKWDETQKAIIDERVKHVNASIENLLTRNKEDKELEAQLKTLNGKILQLRNTRNNEIFPALRQGKISAAVAISTGKQDKLFNEIQDLAKAITVGAQDAAQQAINTSRQTAQHTIRTFLIVGVTAVFLSGFLALFLSHSIASPLREAVLIADRVAAGDLTVKIVSDGRRDEVGLLTDSLSRMVKSLQEMISDVNAASNILSTAANEISASTSQLASSAGETATSVTQTTATIEEIRQTAQVTTQKARNVSQTSQQMVSISQQGQRATRETSEGMQHIREQMEAIAEGMMRLSEQSQAIGQIIATVDDLAQQSNLLAVNASIEAAKAGEQGKGFAVVANEVKSLADQSKQATTQVRVILTDIQKATGAAVLATEQGSKAVEKGVSQSEQAGQAILVLAESVEEAAQAATQIAATSQQQLVGMDQVAQAMENVKQASNQNVAGARQLEDAARNLTELGKRLQCQIERFEA